MAEHDLKNGPSLVEAVHQFIRAGLDETARDALPFGAILVDGDGVILSCNTAACHTLGSMPEQLIGRGFFRDVAPCTDMPGFHGRFQDGILRGSLDVSFSFVFTFPTAPTRTEIYLLNATGPNRYWIFFCVIERLRLARLEQAQSIVEKRVRTPATSTLEDSKGCEQEPIHIPGAIQPWGVLLIADPDTLGVVSCSANTADLLPFAADTLPGKTLGEIL